MTENPDIPRWLYDLAVGLQDPRKPRKNGAHLPKEQRERYKTTISLHRLYGISWATTCKQLAINKESYYKLLKEIALESLHGELKRREILLVNYYSGKQADIMEANAAYQRTKQLGFLLALTHMRDELFDRLQSAGFLPKAIMPSMIDYTAKAEPNPIERQIEAIAKFVEAEYQEHKDYETNSEAENPANKS